MLGSTSGLSRAPPVVTVADCSVVLRELDGVRRRLGETMRCGSRAALDE